MVLARTTEGKILLHKIHTFSSLLGRMVSEVNAKQSIAGQAVAGLQSGQPVTLHQAMISMEEASVSFQLMVEVRNKRQEAGNYAGVIELFTTSEKRPRLIMRVFGELTLPSAQGQ